MCPGLWDNVDGWMVVSLVGKDYGIRGPEPCREG